MKKYPFIFWVSSIWLLCGGNGYGQDSLVHRNLEFYLDFGTANSPLLKDNLNAITLNRIDSLINIATNKPYVQAIGQFLYAPAGTNWGYDQSTTNGGAYAQQQQSFRELLLILLSASLLVFIVLLFLFRDLKAASLILLISMLGVSGSFIALYLTKPRLMWAAIRGSS